jgi:hypothetical protein
MKEWEGNPKGIFFNPQPHILLGIENIVPYLHWILSYTKIPIAWFLLSEFLKLKYQKWRASTNIQNKGFLVLLLCTECPGTRWVLSESSSKIATPVPGLDVLDPEG